MVTDPSVPTMRQEIDERIICELARILKKHGVDIDAMDANDCTKIYLPGGAEQYFYRDDRILTVVLRHKPGIGIDLLFEEG